MKTETEQKVITLGNLEFTATIIGRDMRNLTFLLVGKGVALIFRIYYDSKTSKGYTSYSPINIYFEGTPSRDMGNYSSSYEAYRVTDAILFVERKAEWILEYIMRELDR